MRCLYIMESKYKSYTKFKVVDDYELEQLDKGWDLLDSFIVEDVFTDYNTVIDNNGLSHAQNNSIVYKRLKFLLGRTRTAEKLYSE